MYYSKNSRTKVIHNENCRHLGHIKKENLKGVDMLSDKNDYRVCKHCANLNSQYEVEKAKIKSVCREKGISVKLMGSYLDINTIYDQWRVIFDRKKGLQLYHKNSMGFISKGPFPDYHRQKMHAKSLLACMNYIEKHDDYRQNNPLGFKPNKKKPVKGSRRWNSMEKRKEKKI